MTCFLKPPRPGSVQELVSGDRGFFCDICFNYMHDKKEILLDQLPLQRKLAMTMMYERSKDAYLIGQRYEYPHSSNENHLTKLMRMSIL